MGFQERLDVERWLGRVACCRGSSQQFGQDRAVHDLFDVAQSAGDVGSVEHAMVVDQLDDDPAGGRVDRAVGQRGRQRRDGVNLLGPERSRSSKGRRSQTACTACSPRYSACSTRAAAGSASARG